MNRRHEEPPLYIVAGIKNDGIVFGWTSAVYAEVIDARREQAEAAVNGVSGQRVFALRPVPALVLTQQPR